MRRWGLLVATVVSVCLLAWWWLRSSVEPEPAVEQDEGLTLSKRVKNAGVPSSRRLEPLTVADIELEADRGPPGGYYFASVHYGPSFPASGWCNHFGSGSAGWDDTLAVMALAPEDMPLRADLIHYFEAVAYGSVYLQNRFVEKLDSTDPWQRYFKIQVALSELPQATTVDPPVDLVEEARKLYREDPEAPFASDLLGLAVFGDDAVQFAREVYARGWAPDSEQVSRLLFCDTRLLKQMSASDLRQGLAHVPSGEPNLLMAAFARASQLDDEALTASLLSPSWRFVNRMDMEPACNVADVDELPRCAAVRDVYSEALERVGRLDVTEWEHQVRQALRACSGTPTDSMSARFEEEVWRFEWFRDPDPAFGDCVEAVIRSVEIPEDAAVVNVSVHPVNPAPKGLPVRPTRRGSNLGRMLDAMRQPLSSEATEP